MNDFKTFLILANHWREAHAALSIRPSWREFWRIFKAYGEPGRFYHARPHLVYGLNFINRYGEPPRLAIIKLAFFYHDVVYVIGAKDNEEKSAEQFKAYLKGRIPDPDLARGAKLITDTADHQSVASREWAWQVMNDADLAILGTERPVYMEYAKNVRREYASAPAQLYREGRIKFLEGFVEKRIYRTEPMERAEAIAVSNLRHEIMILKTHPEEVLVV